VSTKIYDQILKLRLFRPVKPVVYCLFTYLTWTEPSDSYFSGFKIMWFLKQPAANCFIAFRQMSPWVCGNQTEQ